jgi:hypothetical protein
MAGGSPVITEAVTGTSAAADEIGATIDIGPTARPPVEGREADELGQARDRGGQHRAGSGIAEHLERPRGVVIRG